MRKTSAIGFAVFLFSVLAQSQIPTGGNVFFGYSYSRGSAFTHNFAAPPTPANASINMNGWAASVEGKYLPWIGVVADFDWHYGSGGVAQCAVLGCTSRNSFRLNASRHELTFGPRGSVSIGRYTPFAQLLIGLAHQTDSGRGGTSNSDTTFATAIGGGLDYKLIKGVAWRVQMDSIHTHFFGSGHNDIRFSTGIVFRF